MCHPSHQLVRIQPHEAMCETCSALTVGGILLSQSPLHGLGTGVTQEASLPVKTGKELAEYLSFLHLC